MTDFDPYRLADADDFSDSKLRTLFQIINTYAHVDDVDPWLFGLAVAVSKEVDGDPLWGMFVGAPSGGKTEVIRLVNGAADQRLDEITAASLIFWRKQRGKDVPSGILTRLPSPAFVTIADFSTVLAGSNRGSRDELFALLRKVYDGEVQRDNANGPTSLRWEGKVTLLAACTSAIDNYATYGDALGPRWLYLRLRPRVIATQRQVMQAARTTNKTAARHSASLFASAIVTDAARRLPDIQLDAPLATRIEDAALVASWGRASVPRDSFGKREINGLPETEEPTRLANQLTVLARALLALGLEPERCVAVMRRAAIDSMPEIRARVLRSLASGASFSAAEVARRASADRKVVTRNLEDYAAIDLAEDGALGWCLARDRADLVKSVVLENNRLTLVGAAG